MEKVIDGVNVYYERSGEGLDVLLLHGWGGKCESFLPITRDFSDKACLTALDFPGHGRSGEPPRPWSVNEYMCLTLHLMDALGIKKADLIAHSFGGRVALLLAAEYPERVGRMVLTGCAGIPNRQDGKISARTRLYKALRALSDNALTRKALGEKTVNGWREALIQRFGSEDYKALTPSMRATFNRVLAQDLTPCLARIKAPTLLFWGENDTATPLWMGKLMEKEIPDAGLAVMPGCGHFAYLDRYDSFRPALERFLINR